MIDFDLPLRLTEEEKESFKKEIEEMIADIIKPLEKDKKEETMGSPLLKT